MYKQFKNLDGSVCDTAIIRTGDNAFIPFYEANTDYQAYLAWVAEGNVAEPADQQGEQA